MKIAIPKKKKNLKSEMDDRFGRAEFFIIASIDEKGNENIEWIENLSKDNSNGAGTTSAKALSDRDVNVIITKGEIGPKAMAVIKEFELSVYDGSSFSLVGDAFTAFKKGELKKSEEPKSGLRRA